MSSKSKIAVTDRQFIWVQNDDSGQVILHVGPTMFAPHASQHIVENDGQEALRSPDPPRPQRMIELNDLEYAVLHNPIDAPLDPSAPNGAFTRGRNASATLRFGERQMVPGPCSFYLHPGQRAEIRDAYVLSSNQYLLTRVYGDVDHSAPYFDLTARSAAITTAVTDLGEGAASTLAEVEPVELTRGQLVVIRGLDTPFYIPPTGVEIVPDLSLDEHGTQLSASQARKVLAERALRTTTTTTETLAPTPEPEFILSGDEIDRLLDATQTPKSATKKDRTRQRREKKRLVDAEATRELERSAPHEERARSITFATASGPSAEHQALLGRAAELQAQDVDALLRSARDPDDAARSFAARAESLRDDLQSARRETQNAPLRLALGASARGLARAADDAHRRARSMNVQQEQLQHQQSFEAQVQGYQRLDQLALDLDAPADALMSVFGESTEERTGLDPDPGDALMEGVATNLAGLSGGGGSGFVSLGLQRLDDAPMKPLSLAKESIDERSRSSRFSTRDKVMDVMEAEAEATVALDGFGANFYEDDEDDDEDDEVSFDLKAQTREPTTGRGGRGRRAEAKREEAPVKRSPISIRRAQEQTRRRSGASSGEEVTAKKPAAPPQRRRRPASPPPPPPPPTAAPAAARLPLPEPEPVELRGPTRAELAAEQVEQLGEEDIQGMLASAVHRRELERQARLARLVRNAVVLGEKEFCVLLDADGQRLVRVGPARIFPGPYDRFLSRGSRRRVYDAYELLPTRGLWLKVVREIARDRLRERLPSNTPLDSEIYRPGDDLLIHGVNTFFFPFDEIEVLGPDTGAPHVGNDHTQIFIEALIIQQHSGVYVRDFNSGEVQLIRGQRSYMLDPRREVRVQRAVSAREWNLWIAAAQPHKRVSEPVSTPWAIAVDIPAHHAAQVLSGTRQQRVVEGPRVELLEYDESLRVLGLSRGTSLDASVTETCFLRIRGDRVRDTTRAQTRDLIDVDIQWRVSVLFDPEARDRWFEHDDPIGLLRRDLRAFVRRACREVTLLELWRDLDESIRAAILGPDGEPRRLEHCGIIVTDAAIIGATLLDPEIDAQLRGFRQSAVIRGLNERLEHERLSSRRLHHSMENERRALSEEAATRASELRQHIESLQQHETLDALRKHDAHGQLAVTLNAQRELSTLLSESTLADERADATLEEQRRADAQRAELQAQVHAEEVNHLRVLEALEQVRLAHLAHSLSSEHAAIPRALVEALSVLGDRVAQAREGQHLVLPELLEGEHIMTLIGQWITDPTPFNDD